jgi:hypothetical protein
MNDELERMWKEAVMACLKVPPMQPLGGTEGNHEYLSQVVGVSADIRAKHLPNTNLELR